MASSWLPGMQGYTVCSYKEEVLHQSEISGYFKIYSAGCVMLYKIVIIDTK